MTASHRESAEAQLSAGYVVLDRLKQPTGKQEHEALIAGAQIMLALALGHALLAIEERLASIEEPDREMAELMRAHLKEHGADEPA